MEQNITDKHITVQALQHLLIYYEKKQDKYRGQGREDVLKTIDTYIAKIRRTMIKVLEKNENEKSNAIDFY